MRLLRVRRRTPQIPGRPPAWQRRWRRHRRLVAACLAGVAAFGVASAAAAPAPPTRPALVATHDLAPGARLRASDVAPAARPVDALPADAVAPTEPVTGRVVADAVHAGEPVRSRDLLSSRLVPELGAGLVATPVRLADASVTALLAPGDVIDVLAARDTSVGAVDGSPVAATGSAQVVAADVRVLVAGASTATSDSVLGGTGASSDGGLLVVASTPQQALDLARAAAGARLSVTLRPD